MPTLHNPSVDESFARLHRAGWSIGETGGAGVWHVTGTNGENVIHAEGRTQAGAVGMLAIREGKPDSSRF
ncbi:MAG: hypothetical protein ACRELG_06605 [Gemmataceae bacterium]